MRHCINFRDKAKIIKHTARRVPVHFKDEVAAELQKMLDKGVIRPSVSEIVSPIVLVRKKTGDLRMCIDYRDVNEITIKEHYPLPRIDELVHDKLASAGYFTSLDLAEGYWQVPIREEDKYKTAFITEQGTFEFNVMPFGLCNAPATFQRMMNEALAEEIAAKKCVDYLDDVLIFGKRFWADLVPNVRAVCDKLRAAKLKIKWSKCHFGERSIEYLGHIISKGEIRPSPSKIKAIVDFPKPKTEKHMRGFLGLINHFRKFIPHCGALANPLYESLKDCHKYKTMS